MRLWFYAWAAWHGVVTRLLRVRARLSMVRRRFVCAVADHRYEWVRIDGPVMSKCSRCHRELMWKDFRL